MRSPRAEPACVKLSNGLILVAGGKDASGALASCEIYDPINDQWLSTGSMRQARYRCPFIQLNDGRVLAIGGLTDLNVATTATCELYDPSTGIWSPTSNLPEADENASAIKLPNGLVFVVGGLNANSPAHYLNLALLYDPSSGTFTTLPKMSMSLDGVLVYYSAVNNSALVCGGVFGGFNGFYPRTSQIFSFSNSIWSLGDSSIEPRDNGQLNAIQMPDGKPLLVSGRTGPNQTTANIESFDWSTRKWSHVGQLSQAHWHCITLRIGNDSILMIGGSTPTFTNVSAQTTWYKYSSATSWAGPDLNVAREEYCGIVDNRSNRERPCEQTSTILIFGGQDPTGKTLSSCEALSLGLKSSATPPSAQVALSINGKSCVDTIVSLRVTSGACDSLTIDSLAFVGTKNFGVVPLLSVRGVPAGDSTELLLTLMASNAGEDTGVVRIFCHSRSTLDTLSSTVVFSRSATSASLSASSLSASGTVCQAPSAALRLNNPGCDSAVVDSVTFEGPDGKYFVVALIRQIGPSDSTMVSVSLPVDTARTYSSRLHLFYHIGTHRDSLSSSLHFSVGGASALNTRALIADVLDAHPGDTINVPILLTGGNSTAVQGYKIEADYDRDLLQMIPPDYGNSLSVGTTIQDINRTSTGATLFVPTSVTVNQGKLLTLRFTSFLSGSECTVLRLRSLVFSPDDPKFSACILSTNLDSAEVCVHAACGDAELRSVLEGITPTINWVEMNDGALRVSFSGNQSARLSIFDVMGRNVSGGQRLIPTGISSIDVASLPVGIYILRLDCSGIILSKRIVVVR